ncbi:hypothetical protein NMS_0968 [Nonlabens marinus S1-08]|uniref:Uncharacterized protein n=1 Tax=Nonlabens marinus S1-08 TaxID=1454201 RepID=W8VWR6_9FLAO|nr:hypothetical protein NMS_0968 [Nonlabens marinus S1-08]
MVWSLRFRESELINTTRKTHRSLQNTKSHHCCGIYRANIRNMNSIVILLTS